MAKYRLLTRIGDNRDELQWNNYNIEKYIEPPILVSNSKLKSTLLSLYSDNKQVSYITSFKRSINPPSDNTNTVRIDDNSNGTPIYAWLSNESDSDILYYTQADKIIVNDGEDLFRNYNNCITIDVDIFDTSNMTDMSSMFYNCSSLTSLNLSNFNTSKVTKMNAIFYNCSSLLSLESNISNWDVSNVTTMNNMFSLCKLTSLDLSNWNTSNVSTMFATFSGCNLLISLNLSNWNTSKLTYTYGMFSHCDSLTTLDISNFDMFNVGTMNVMFDHCDKLSTIICTEETEQWIRNNATTIKIDNINNITFNRPSL